MKAEDYLNSGCCSKNYRIVGTFLKIFLVDGEIGTWVHWFYLFVYKVDSTSWILLKELFNFGWWYRATIYFFIYARYCLHSLETMEWWWSATIFNLSISHLWLSPFENSRFLSWCVCFFLFEVWAMIFFIILGANIVVKS